MNGIVIKALLNLIAKYVDQHGAELFDKLLALILAKLNPETATCEATGDPVLVEFAAEAQAILDNPPAA